MMLVTVREAARRLSKMHGRKVQPVYLRKQIADGRIPAMLLDTIYLIEESLLSSIELKPRGWQKGRPRGKKKKEGKRKRKK